MVVMLMLRILLAFAAAPVVGALFPLPAQAEVAAGGGKAHQVFGISRNGTPIGTTKIDIDRQDDTTIVKIATTISVKMMFFEAYRYDYNGTETWKAGQLVAYKSRTNDNGTKHTIEATQKPDKLSMEVDGKHTEVPKSVVPASLWTKTVINQPELFEPANGKRLQVKFKDLGEESLSVNGVQHKAEHYQVTAKPGDDFDRDLWFDGDTLVRMKLYGSDGSTILSELRASP